MAFQIVSWTGPLYPPTTDEERMITPNHRSVFMHGSLKYGEKGLRKDNADVRVRTCGGAGMKEAFIGIEKEREGMDKST